MPTEYVRDQEMQDAVTDMLTKESFAEFNPIREHEVKIEVCSCVRTTKEGENAEAKEEPVMLKKIGPLEKVFVNADYIIVVDNSAWAEANEIQRNAIIHRGLMKINIEVKEGKIKVGTRKPNIVEFTETIVRYGTYREPLLNLREAMTLASKQVVRKMQIEKA